MAEETQETTKIPNLSEEEREWVAFKLIGLKPREVYGPFMEEFPRLAEFADEHEISDEEVQSKILNRFYAINSRRDSDLTEFIDNLDNVRILLLTSGAFTYHMLSLKQVVRMKHEIDEALKDPNLTEEEVKLLERKSNLLDKQQKRAAHMGKTARDQIKFDAAIGKLLQQKETGSASAGQPKETQTPGETDWAALKRERDERIKSGEENVPD